MNSIPALSALCLALALPAPARSGTEPATLTLYHAFATAKPGVWAAVSVTTSVADDPAAWRVGRPDGPAASRSQLDAVLAAVTWVVVGAGCPAVSSGATHYPCAFELAAPLDAPRPGALRMDWQWASTSGDLLRRYEPAGTPSSLIAYSTPHANADTQVAGIPSMLAVDPSFVGLYAPHTFSGRSVRTLSFRVRTHASEHSAPRVTATPGLLILGTGKPAGTDLENRPGANGASQRNDSSSSVRVPPVM